MRSTSIGANLNSNSATSSQQLAAGSSTMAEFMAPTFYDHLVNNPHLAAAAALVSAGGRSQVWVVD